MKRPIGDVFADWIGIKTTGPKPILNWEGIYFFAVGILLLFQEYYLTVEISGVITNSRFLALYTHFTASILFANRFLVAPFLGFFLYASLRSTSLGLPRRLCDLLGVYYLMRMVTLLIGLNILIFDVTSSRYVLITQLLFFLPYSLLVWGWVYWRLDTGAGRKCRQLFRLDIEGENPRPVDYLIASFSSVFSASISAIKGRSARARVLILLHGFVIYDVMGLTLSRAVALVQAK
jgi:hypothetical protein